MTVSTRRTEADQNTLAAGAINLPELVFTALATLAPLTLVAAVMPLHFLVGGDAVPGGYLVAAAIMALFAVGLNAVTRYLRSPGAFYAIITRGLGRPIGGLSATLAVLAYNSLQISTYGAIGVYAADSVARWSGVQLPWWAYGVVTLLIVGFLGARGITASAKVLGTVLVLEILALILLAIAVLVSPDIAGVPLEVYTPATVLRPESLAMFALIFGAFMGFESTAIYSEEVRGGARTVRRATYIVVAFIGVFYSLMALVIVAAYGAGGIGEAAGNDTAGLVIALYERFTSPLVFEIVNVLLILSAFAALLALHNASNRYVYTLGKEGIFPARLGRTDPRTKAPRNAGLLQSAAALIVLLICILGNVDPYNVLLLVGSAVGFLAIIILWALCSLASLVYLRRNHPQVNLWSSLIAPGLAFVGLTAMTVIVIINFDLYSLGDPVINVIVAVLMAVAVVGGVWRTLALRRGSPAVYAALGNAAEHQDDDDDPEGSGTAAAEEGAR